MITEEMIDERRRLKREHYKNAATKRPAMGTWHTITERAIKVRENGKCNWEREPIEDRDLRYGNDSELITSYRAMYIGYRYKFNGEWQSSVDYDDGDIPNYFQPSETVEVWLFVTHDNRDPIAVFPFEVEVIQD